MLYLGEYFFIKVFSKIKASYSLSVVMYSIKKALEIKVLVLISFIPEKYEESS